MRNEKGTSDNATLAGRLYRILDDEQISQKEFARRIAISKGYASQLLSGEHTNISKSLARLIGKEFKVDPHWVLTGDQVPSDTSSGAQNDPANEHPDGLEFARRLGEIVDVIFPGGSRKAFAESLGMAPSTLNEYLKGRVPPADQIARICDIHGVSADWILHGRGEMLVSGNHPPPGSFLVAERILFIRKRAKLSSSAFAKRAGISRAYVSQLESGARTSIGRPAATLIARTFGYQTEWICSGRGEMTVERPAGSTGNAVDRLEYEKFKDNRVDKSHGGLIPSDELFTDDPPEEFSSLAKRILFIRKHEGLSGYAFSAATNIAVSQVSRYEKGKNPKISRPVGTRISEAFGYRLEWIRTGTGPVKVGREDVSLEHGKEFVNSPSGTAGFADRLRMILGDGSTSEFSRKCGCGEALIRKYLEMGSLPGLANFVRIAENNGVNYEWLATGRGPLRTTGLLLGSAPGFIVVSPLDRETGDPYRSVILDKSWIQSRLGGRHSDKLVWSRANDDAMAPVIAVGDVFVVDLVSDGHISDGISLIKAGETTCVRRLQVLMAEKRVRVLCDNPRYGSEVFDLGITTEAGLSVLGRVVWVGKSL